MAAACGRTPSFSPLTHNFYMMGVNQAYSITDPADAAAMFPAQPTVGQRTGGAQQAEVTPVPARRQPHRHQCRYRQDRLAGQDQTIPCMAASLATASNLLFTGEMTGDFDAFDAKTGKKLWHYFMGAGVCTPPITYRVKGVQYLAVGASGCARGREYLDETGLPQYADNLVIFAVK